MAGVDVSRRPRIYGEGEMTWDNRYRMLREGEVILDGDECLTDSHLGWQKDIHCVGQCAPNPYYSSHRIYRRIKGEQGQP